MQQYIYSNEGYISIQTVFVNSVEIDNLCTTLSGPIAKVDIGMRDYLQTDSVSWAFGHDAINMTTSEIQNPLLVFQSIWRMHTETAAASHT